MCSTRITFHPFCFNFHFASLAFPLQLYISSVFLEHVFHFHTQYFFPYFFPLSQMIVSIIVALLLRSKGSCSTCSQCTYKSLLMDGWWLLLPVNVSLDNQQFQLQDLPPEITILVANIFCTFYSLRCCQTWLF